MLSLLSQLKAENLISELNYQFAKFIDTKQQTYRYSPQQQNLAILLSALVSYNVMQGHSCVRLNSALAQNPFGLKDKTQTQHFYLRILQKIDHIPPREWQNLLESHIAFSQHPDHIAPLLFQHERIYFYRYWQAEYRIARYFQQAVSSSQPMAENRLIRTILSRFFTPQKQIDWQQIAVASALRKPFCLISGGPGTGKTRTVTILLAALQLQQVEQGLPPFNIALAAPTGKAAARLKESISTNLGQLDIPLSLKAQIPLQAATIHSLIGSHPDSDTPRHHAKNPLNVDLVVVDEASMIDLFTMEKLLNALKLQTRLIMLGDKDQLASVEAGNAMGELGELTTLGYSQAHSDYLSQTTGYPIFSQNQQVPPICDALCHLRHSYRFDENSGIGQLAAMINAKQAVNSWQLFTKGIFDDLTLCPYPSIAQFSEKRLWQRACVSQVVEQAVIHYRDYLELVKKRITSPATISVQAIFSAFQKVRFLSALRVGELGVEQLNQAIAEALQHAHLVRFKQSRENYLGKPILITENAPQQHIFSGDIGIVLPDEQGRMRIYFETEIDNKPLSISPSRVPSYEAAYVMTVHKSQGSEFEHTFLIMPLYFSSVLSKELLYTAVTRAKHHFTLFSDDKIWKKAVQMDIQRQSGLNAQLFQLFSSQSVEV